MNKIIYCLLLTFSIVEIGHAQSIGPVERARDTTVVGVLIGTDSIFPVVNESRIGTRYYYGVHHLKIGIIDIRDSLVKDTMIIAYVYNIISELKSYFSNFNMKVGRNYIFDLGQFSPCRSDFPKLEGSCRGDGVFSPVSNKLIKQYDKIYRVINMVKWNGLVKGRD